MVMYLNMAESKEEKKNRLKYVCTMYLIDSYGTSYNMIESIVKIKTTIEGVWSRGGRNDM